MTGIGSNGLEYLLHGAALESEQERRLRAIGYYDAPASKGHHLAYRGGLVLHSYNVARRLVILTNALGVAWSRPQSPYLVALLHDLVKCKCYRLRPDSGYDYVQPEWPGHGVASVMIATVELGIRLEPDETAAIIHHMGAFGLQGRALDEFDAALDKWPKQIIATHTADWAAARIDEEGKWREVEP